MDQPYRGLQPYQEKDEKFFFGRDTEKAILIDKVLADKLTLLFAASGVGKSSLLQAAVMPELKRATGENLDVVYYNDWVSPPLEGLRQKILSTLQEHGKMSRSVQASAEPTTSEPTQRNDSGVSVENVGSAALEPTYDSADRLASVQVVAELTTSEPATTFRDFLYLCAAFASEPLVIILDQFEEFFQYQRYTAEFEPFIAALAEAIRDRATPVNFLIAMREDFALNLNAFKGHLPTILFENYFRLEKLERDAAKAAIEKPVKGFGFSYEQGLLDDLLKDLADQEREGRLGAHTELVPENAPAYVEPPNVQIVCSQLWDLEKDNPAQVIRARTYHDQGGAKGFIRVYFQRVISAFTPAETRLASKAFDHLVTPRGTKMAYPVAELSAKLRVAAAALTRVLAKLEHARILRSQERKRELWYELYHDIFAGIITGWNTRYKERQRTRRALLGAGLLVLLALGLMAGYNAGRNLTSHHLRVSLKTDKDTNQYIAPQIDIYRGQAQSWDLFRLQRYAAEADYGHPQLEPDKFFSAVKPVANYQALNVELIGQLPIAERIQAFWQAGELQRAFDLAQKSITQNDRARAITALKTVAEWRSPQVCAEMIQPHLHPSENLAIRVAAIEMLAVAQCPDAIATLRPLLNDSSLTVRSSTVNALRQLRDVDGLLTALQDTAADNRQNAKPIRSYRPTSSLQVSDADIRQNAAEALGQIGDARAVDGLLARLADENGDVRVAAAAALGQIGDSRAVDGLVARLADDNRYDVLGTEAWALGQIGDAWAVESLIARLADDSASVRVAAAVALGQIGEARAVDGLLARLADEVDFVRREAAQALGQIGEARAVDGLIARLADEESDVRKAAAEALGQIGDARAVDGLLARLADEYEDVRGAAIVALGQIGEARAVDGLIARLAADNESVRQAVVEAVGQIGGDRAVDGLLARLADEDSDVRRYAAEALGQIADARAVDGLLARLAADNESVRRAAAEALGQIGDTRAIDGLLARLADENEYVRRAAAEALGQIGDARAVDGLLARLADEYEDVRGAAIVALGQIGEARAVDGLLARLADEDSDVWLRQAVVEALGQIGEARAVDGLLARLADENGDVRVAAARALGQFGDPRAVDDLLARLADNVAHVPEAAARALGEIGEARAVDGLLALLLDENENMRQVAAQALGQIGDARAMDSLIARIADKNSGVRSSAAQALGQSGNAAAIPALIRLLSDTSMNNYRQKIVQHAAAIALAQLHAPEAIAPLQKQLAKKSSDHIAIAAALLALGHNDGLVYLQAALPPTADPSVASGSTPTKRMTAEVLGAAPSPEGSQILRALLNAPDKDVKLQAIASLGQTHDPANLPVLDALRNDADKKIHDAATTALLELAAPESLNFLKAYALDPQARYANRVAALRALGKLGADAALLELLDNQTMAAFTLPIIRTLGHMRSAAAREPLQQRLHAQSARRAQWRKIMAENPTDEQKQAWLAREAAVHPQTDLEFHLAYALSRIDAATGVKLLEHDLANVRAGAWTGLAQLPHSPHPSLPEGARGRPSQLQDGMKAVELVRELDQKRNTSKDPLFKHAAYRAIDGMLITIETYGGAAELAALKEFLPAVQDTEGVKTRAEWTIARLEER